MAAASAPIAEEGQVIGIHTLQQWTDIFEKYKDCNKLVVVDFTASWCGPCRFMAPILADYAKKMPHVIFIKVDVDELPDVTQVYEVKAMPTFVFLKGGKVVHTVVGAKKDELHADILIHAGEASTLTA
ncbi:unnamed protein product [Cuscuta campestris]|uniref:Thioredoxin domain-containing protein n=2 Tax=Cuscuta sect. Cleistogrammica TaxID=1824901 RepID=A0A484NFI3_9ASTE|nr:hypothetical protein DM860_013318 [Cuscuta australis]VFQ99186.1 unnamed protein product [Cuscuta campestris]